MERLRSLLLTIRDLLIAGGPFLLLAIGALVFAYRWVDPQPPRSVVMATGPVNSDYERFGLRYKEILARHGIDVQLRSTNGSRANLDLLRDESSAVQVAFVRSSATPMHEATDSGLVSLGSLFYEPVWLFSRNELKLDSLVGLRNRRVNLAPEGSGTASLVGSLLEQNAIVLTDLKVSRLEDSAAVAQLLDGDLDAVFFTSASNNLLIQMLLRTPGVRLFDFKQAEAYTRRLPSLNRVVLPRGVVDLARDVPRANIQLVAPTSTLLATDGTHPAILNLLVQAAREIHGVPDWFARAGEFPSSRSTDYPLATEAERLYRAGPPLLQRYLPFWMANLIERMWLVVLSLAALLIPLSRIVPPLYQWRVRSRIYRWYGQLRSLERRLDKASAADAATPQWREQLDELEARVNEITVPLSYADELYSLRQHIALVRRRLAP